MRTAQRDKQQGGTNMRKVCFSLFMAIAFNIYANDDLINEYNVLYNDVSSFNISGYKSSWDSIGNKGGDKINFQQGALMRTGFNTNLGIVGEGFFKIRLENDMVGYTRYGNFSEGFGDSESDFTLRTARYGYKLYDPVVIPSYTVTLRLERNMLYAFLPDGTKAEAGQINVYKVDEEKLIRYKDSIFITSDNHDSQITSGSRIITGCVEMSNVFVLETLMRMHTILCELKNYGYDYNDKDQIIMTLISNIPLLNELSMIRMKLFDNQLQPQNMLLTDLRGLRGYELLESSLNFIKIE